MNKTIRIVIVEDDETDVELLLRELRRCGLEPEASIARSESELRDALAGPPPDLVCSDYTMPGFDGNAALRLCQELHPGVPFLFVSGSIGEVRAIEALKAGAVDYILKDSLARLGPAVERALREAAQRAEKKALEDQLRQAQKMEAIGRLAGGVAHDFNNMLTAVSGYAELLCMSLPEDDPRRADVEEILKTVARATALTRHMLAFSRRQVVSPRLLDANEVITGVAKMLKRVIGEDIEFATSLEPAGVPIVCDAGQLEQILLNLSVNARDAMPRGGRLAIATRRTETDAVLTVGDTGCGMSPEVQARIFEPFYTTKETGTGLGLSTVAGIVKEYAGAVCVESSAGRGTTFTVSFPLARRPATPAPETPRDAAPAGGSETVLLVEDDPVLRVLSRRILSERGYAVLDAPGAEDALRLKRAHKKRIAILVTDVVMPGLSGPELARRLRAEDPELRVLFLSGYIDERVKLAPVEPNELSFLQKPFSPRDLAQRARALLDAPPGPLLAERSEPPSP